MRPSSKGGRATIPHLLNADELPLLRCLMTLLLLPSETNDLSPSKLPFTAAIERLHTPPRFRTLMHDATPPSEWFEGIKDETINLFLVAGSIPTWLRSLSEHSDIGVLTQSEEIIESAKAVPRLHTGLLKGDADLPEAYRVFRELLSAAARKVDRDPKVSERCRVLANTDIFAQRSRLDFIPPLPLPPPSEGRPATYLINRFSNNVEVAGIVLEGPPASLTMPQMLEWCRLAGGAFSYLENDQDLPSWLGVPRSEVEERYKQLLSDKESIDAKFKLFTKFGLEMTRGIHLRHPFYTLGAPRLDIIRGKVPDTLKVDTNHKKSARTMIRAVNDLMSGAETQEFANDAERELYAYARFTLLSEQRLISCQTAWLAARSGSIPIQLLPASGQLYNLLADLNSALANNSRKISRLFNETKVLLAESLPEGITHHLGSDVSPVVLFSDLPYEWALIGEWPLCLTRPVSRVPLGQSHWDVLSSVLEHPVKIDKNRPEKVLVFDLIEQADRIRLYSDAFIFASSALEQHYNYASPKSAQEFIDVLSKHAPDIVVLDTHASYDRPSDALTIRLGQQSVPLGDLLSNSRVPPLWILSACDTSVTGAIRGSFVRELLARGAVCVVATLSRIDAFTASIFVGRLLTDNIYNPGIPEGYDTFGEVFFSTQYTTAMLYDPLLPLFRVAEREESIKPALQTILSEYFQWSIKRGIDVKTYGNEAAHVLGELIARTGLRHRYTSMRENGLVRPETLLFSAFGFPEHLDLR